MKRRTLIAALAALPLLPACTSFSEITGTPEETLEGRFSAALSLNGARRVETGGFALSSGPGGEQLDIRHPAAGVIARLSVTPALSVLEAGGHRYEDASPEALMLRELGFAIPVRGFPRWAATRSLDEFEEDGWKISIAERDSAGLPKLIRASRPEAGDAPAIRLTVFIENRTRHAL